MKKIIIILSILLMTGCSVNYDLTITDKEQIKEEFKIYIDNSEILQSYSSIDEYLDYYSNIYKENQGKEYSIKTKESKPQSYFIVNNSYKNLDEYIASTSFLSMFNSANIERVGNYISFTTSTNSFLSSIKNNELLSEETANNTFKIRIKFYNEIASSNADSVDEKNNIYIWEVNKNTEKDYIYFKIGPKVKYNIIIKDFIKNNLAAIIITITSLIIVAIGGVYIYSKAKKNNEV